MPSFADRLDELFRTTCNPESGKPYSVREVAVRVRLSHTHLNRLRSGEAGDPRMSEVESLARFFNVPVARLIGDTTVEPSSAPGGRHRDAIEEALLQPGVHQLAMRMIEQQLSPEGTAAILRIIDEVARLEGAQRNRGENPG